MSENKQQTGGYSIREAVAVQGAKKILELNKTTDPKKVTKIINEGSALLDIAVTGLSTDTEESK